MNTDNNAYLTKEELMEASKVSDDISALNFSNKQLENLIGMMIVNWLHTRNFLLESLLNNAPNYLVRALSKRDVVIQRIINFF